jgi:thioesterase domain-containing protein
MNGTVAECQPNTGNARVVQMKVGRPGPCLFLVPGTGGRVEGFENFATLLHTPMPVFAIEARGVDGSGEPDSNIEQLVSHYLSRVRALQATGPYFLLGHSFGGMVAFEMAQRLIEAKESVGCLILLDTVIPKRFWPLKFLLANLGTRVHGHFMRIMTISIRQSLTYYSRRILLRVYGLHQIPQHLKIGPDSARMLIANEMLGKKWDPKFYPDELTLFCSYDMKMLASIWRVRVRHLEFHSAAGGHLSLIEAPNVVSLANDVSACLIRAQQETVHWRVESEPDHTARLGETAD